MRYILIFFMLAFYIPAKADTENAKIYLNSLAASVLELVRQPNMPNTEFAKQLTIILDKACDYDLMTQFVLGSFARQFPKDEYEKIRASFTKYARNSFIKRFRTYAGETYKIQDAVQLKPGSYIVKTGFYDPHSKSEFSVDWKIIERDGGYKIFDIIVEDISMALTQREEMTAILKRTGGKSDGLIQKLDEQTAKNELK